MRESRNDDEERETENETEAAGDVFEMLKTDHRHVQDLFTRFDEQTIDGFGLDHEGHVSNFADFFSSEIFATYTAEQKINLAAFLKCLDTGTAPAVGYTMTLTSGNLSDASLQRNWTTLQQQARVRNIDLVVRGTLDDEVKALSYRPLFDDYVVDGLPTVTLSRGQLQVLIALGDTLTIMGVPPREGITSAAPSASDLAAAAATRWRGTSRGH